MIQCGIDLVDIKRIREALNKNPDTFLARIAIPSEIARLKNEKRFEEKVAGLFALKESFAKAVGTGIGADLSFHDVEVTYSNLGQPQMTYLGSRYQISKQHIACSVSHEGDLVTGLVVIQK